MEALLQMAFETATQHVPDSAAWIPYTGTGLLALFGLVLMCKGARLAPIMAACAFAGIGAVGGSFVAHQAQTPPWPTIAVAGIVGFTLGIALFRLWLAVLLSTCFITAGLSLYSARVVSPAMQNYASRNFDSAEAATGVTLPIPGAAVVASRSPQAELALVWSHLMKEIPSFQSSFWAIVVSAGLAGLVFGLLLPRASRALFAATAGTFCAGVALTAGLKAGWPAALEWLASLGAWNWVIVAGFWSLSLLYNLADMRGRRPRSAAAADAPQSQPAPA